MGNTQEHSNSFDENQSLHLIREMLQVSKRKFQSDGILMIVWGWIMWLKNFVDYIMSIADFQIQVIRYLEIALIFIALVGFAFTLHYIFKQRKKVQTYIGVSLRYVWVAMFFSLVLINVIQFRVLHEINFELQHPIFMVIIAFATVVTGGILRYQLIVYGGVIFALLALASSYFPLSTQLLLEAVAWFLAFVIPGHILYSRRNSYVICSKI